MAVNVTSVINYFAIVTRPTKHTEDELQFYRRRYHEVTREREEATGENVTLANENRTLTSQLRLANRKSEKLAHEIEQLKLEREVVSKKTAAVQTEAEGIN